VIRVINNSYRQFICRVCFSVLSEHSSGGVGGSGGGGGGGGNDYSAMFSTPPPHKVSPPGPGDLDNMSCSSSSLLGVSGGIGGGHRYPTGPEPANTATSVYNTTPSKYTLCTDHCRGRVRGSNCTLPKVLQSIVFIIYVMGGGVIMITRCGRQKKSPSYATDSSESRIRVGNSDSS